jgi:hypothetical protein
MIKMVSPSSCGFLHAKNNQTPQRKYQKPSKAIKNHPNPSSAAQIHQKPPQRYQTAKKLTEVQ